MQNCFLMPSRLKSHISLVLDRLQCVARVNYLVSIGLIVIYDVQLSQRSDHRSLSRTTYSLNDIPRKTAPTERLRSRYS